MPARNNNSWGGGIFGKGYDLAPDFVWSGVDHYGGMDREIWRVESGGVFAEEGCGQDQNDDRDQGRFICRRPITILDVVTESAPEQR